MAQALLAAVCEKAGHRVTLIDGEVLKLSKRDLARRVVESKPDIVGLTCYSPFFHLSQEVAEEIKKLNPKIPILAGGPHITIAKQEALLPCFDYLFKGEAESSLPQFLERLEAHDDLSKVGGLIYRRDGDIVETGDASWITDISTSGKNLGQHYPLDALPRMARHLLPMDRYFLGTKDGRQHFTSVQSARGCPWRCVFCCSDALKTTRYIMRSPDSIVDEMEQVVTDYPFIRHFFFADDVLTLYAEKHVLRICDGINKSKRLHGRITFEGSTRANLIDDPMMKQLAESGLVRISFGLESVDPEVRMVMNKRVHLDSYWQSNEICNKYGVEALNSMMIGLPGDTKEKVKFTIRTIAAQRHVMQANLAIAIPYPGTEFSDMAAAGEHGLELVSSKLENYRRYGSAVTNVNDLTADDLIKMQNWGFLMIYSKPWRWLPVIRKHGVVGFLLQFVRLWKLAKDIFLDRCRPFVYPGKPA